MISVVPDGIPRQEWWTTVVFLHFWEGRKIQVEEGYIFWKRRFSKGLMMVI
jgi:hypothetical protein